MRKIIFVVSVLLVLSFVHFAYAQFGRGAGPKFHSDFKPVVGGWSEYQMTGKGESPSKMKIAIVGKEGDAYWYETMMETKQEGRIISKMLVSGNPEDQKNIRRMIVKMGNEPAMEMPVQMMPGSRDQGRGERPVIKGQSRSRFLQEPLQANICNIRMEKLWLTPGFIKIFPPMRW
jgi:hypothetical protein